MLKSPNESKTVDSECVITLFKIGFEANQT